MIGKQVDRGRLSYLCANTQEYIVYSELLIWTKRNDRTENGTEGSWGPPRRVFFPVDHSTGLRDLEAICPDDELRALLVSGW